MEVSELYEILTKLIEDGKGSYIVTIRVEDTWEFNTYGNGIVIKGI